MIVTEKQYRIAKLIAGGEISNTEIAMRLGNTRGSIEQHLVKLFKRHGFKSREDLKAAFPKFTVADLRKGNRRKV